MNSNNQPDLQPLKLLLAPIYNPDRRWSYEEECMLLELIREPNWLEEAASVVEYFGGTPANKRQFLPQSMRSLLSDWTGILDKIAISKTVSEGVSVSDKISWQNELKRVEAKIKSIRDSYSEHQDMSHEDRRSLQLFKNRRTELISRLGYAA